MAHLINFKYLLEEFYMKEQFIEFLFSMKWLWAIVVIMLWNIVNSYIKLGYNKLALKKVVLIMLEIIYRE